MARFRTNEELARDIALLDGHEHEFYVATSEKFPEEILVHLTCGWTHVPRSVKFTPLQIQSMASLHVRKDHYGNEY